MQDSMQTIQFNYNAEWQIPVSADIQGENSLVNQPKLAWGPCPKDQGKMAALDRKSALS